MSSEYRKRGSQSAAALTAVGSPHTNRHLEHPVIDETEKDISIEELQDFMSADLFEVQADPTFKNRLREMLWELIESNAFGYGPEPEKANSSPSPTDSRRGRNGKR